MVTVSLGGGAVVVVGGTEVVVLGTRELATGEGQLVAAGVVAPGQGLSWPTMTDVAGGEMSFLPGTYGPEPRARNGIASKALGNIGSPKVRSSGKM